jgi:hypothetical protein
MTAASTQCDARSRESVKNVLVGLTEHAMAAGAA